MRIISGAILSVLLAVTIAQVDAQSPADKQPTTAGAKGFPIPSIPAPNPTPTPNPRGVVVLSADQMYVADFDEDGVLLVRPEGLVKIGRDVGPIRIKGKFADGSGKTETRTYAGKTVYTLEVAPNLQAGEGGRITLDFIPFGLKSSDQVKSAMVDVLHAALPPPDVVPVPPTPKPPTPDASPIAAKGLHVMVVYDPRATLTNSQHTILYGAKTRNYLTANCVKGPDGVTPQMRIWPSKFGPTEDISLESKVWQDTYRRPRASLPWLIVGNLDKGGYEGPITPTMTADEFIAIVAQYK